MDNQISVPILVNGKFTSRAAADIANRARAAVDLTPYASKSDLHTSLAKITADTSPFKTGARYYSPVTYYWPDYYNGERSQWNKVLRFGDSLGIVILNRNSGDWQVFDQDFLTQAQLAKGAGVKRTIFYVKTQYGAAGNPAQWGQGVPNASKFTKEYIMRQLAYCKQHYGALFEGVFLDEFINGWGDHQVRIPWYKDLVDSIRAEYGPQFTIVGNCGSNCNQGVLNLDVDIFMSYEYTAERYLNPPENSPIHTHEMAKYPGTRFWHVVHDVTEENYKAVFAKAEQLGIGHLYITDGRLVMGAGGQWEPEVNPYAVAPNQWIADLLIPWIKGFLDTRLLAEAVNAKMQGVLARLAALEKAGGATPTRPKVVPLSLTAGQNDTPSTGADLTGRTIAVPMLWGAPVSRFRIHMRNINPRTGTQGTDIPVTITRLGKSTAGVISEALDLNLQVTVPGGTDYVSDWISQPLEPNVEYALEFSYTGKSTDNILQCSGGSYVVPASGAPWVRRSTPFHIWLEAETPATTKVYTFNGDSLTVGLNSSADRTGTLPMFDSWPSKLCRLQGTLPIIYAASGDTAADWLANPNSYKVTLWDNLDKGDVFFANMGSNDVFAGSLIDTIKTRATKMVDLFRPRVVQGAPVVTTAILPRTNVVGTDQREVSRRELNAWLANQPSPVGAYKHIDFIEAVSSDDDSIPAEVAADGVHPNAAGYQAIADSVNRQFSASELTPPTFSG